MSEAASANGENDIINTTITDNLSFFRSGETFADAFAASQGDRRGIHGASVEVVLLLDQSTGRTDLRILVLLDQGW